MWQRLGFPAVGPHRRFVAALGIASDDDLFGGVVPYAFAGTKTKEARP